MRVFMASESKNEILLDSGTNEVEMLEFSLGDEHFGVNVSKVKSLIQYAEEDVTELPKSEKGIDRLIKVQGTMVPLVAIHQVLELENNNPPERRIVVILGFNNISVGVLVDTVNEIHRINWNEFVPISEYLHKSSSSTTVGTFKRNDHDIVVLDFERIMMDYFPETCMDVDISENRSEDIFDRSKCKVVHVDDSTVIRTIFQQTMTKGGYTDIKAFINGYQCYEYFLELKEKISSGETTLEENVQAIIIDIEMPRMDGLTLCKKIRQEFQWADLPIILFSSLIDDQMKEKCREVGASTQIAKPHIKDLANILDNFFLKDKSKTEN